MGYYTQRTLTVINGNDDFDYELDISRNSEYKADYNLFDEELNWYDFFVDMTNYSTNNPEVIFKVHGEGEESEDIWEAYFKNGKFQLCKAIIAFEPYDESKLI